MNLVCFTGFGEKVGSVEEMLVFQYLSQFQATCSTEMKKSSFEFWEAKRLLGLDTSWWCEKKGQISYSNELQWPPWDKAIIDLNVQVEESLDYLYYILKQEKIDFWEFSFALCFFTFYETHIIRSVGNFSTNIGDEMRLLWHDCYCKVRGPFMVRVF